MATQIASAFVPNTSLTGSGSATTTGPSFLNNLLLGTGALHSFVSFADEFNKERAVRRGLREQQFHQERNVELTKEELRASKFDFNRESQRIELAARLEQGRLRAGGGFTDINEAGSSNINLQKSIDALRASDQDTVKINELRKKDELNEKINQSKRSARIFKTAADNRSPTLAGSLGLLDAGTEALEARFAPVQSLRFRSAQNFRNIRIR